MTTEYLYNLLQLAVIYSWKTKTKH